MRTKTIFSASKERRIFRKRMRAVIAFLNPACLFFFPVTKLAAAIQMAGENKGGSEKRAGNTTSEACFRVYKACNLDSLFLSEQLHLYLETRC